MKLLKKVLTWSQQHPVKAMTCVALIFIILLVAMRCLGLMPGQSHNHQQVQSSSSSSVVKKKSTKTKQPTAPKTNNPPSLWVDKPKEHANEVMNNMNALLDSKIGVNNATLRQQVSPQESEPTSAYAQAETQLTDAVKQATISPPTSEQDATQWCQDIDKAYAQWQVEAWKAANENLNEQIGQMTTSFEQIVHTIKRGKNYPASCYQFAELKIDTKGTSQQDLQRKVQQITDYVRVREQCSAEMSPEQGSQMPQGE